MKLHIVYAGLLLAVVAPAGAQMCANGTNSAWNPGCGPMNTPPPGYSEQAPGPPPRVIFFPKFYFAALVTSDTHVWQATDQPLLSYAENAALTGCIDNGDAHCRVVVSFSGSCAAIARATPENSYLGQARDSANAEQIAAQKCSAAEQRCEIVASLCQP